MSRWLLALLLLCLPSLLHAQWREAASDHFLLYSDGSEEKLRETAAELERFDRLLRRLMDVEEKAGPRLRIYLMPDREAVLRTTDGSDPELAGYYRNDPAEPLLVASRTSTGDGEYDLPARDVLFHEYAHHVMLQHSRGPHPVWYLEGLAEYYSTTRLVDPGLWEVGVAPLNRVAVLREAKDWIKVDELLAASDYRQFAGRTHLLYAQGWLLAHYVTQDAARRDQLQTYFRLVSGGMTRAAAVDAAFEGSVGDFDRQLRDYARRRSFASQRLHLPPSAAAPLSIRKLRQAEAALIGFDVALRRGVVPSGAEAFALELEAAARPHLDDPYAQRLFALAEQRVAGKPAASLAAKAGPAHGGR